MAINNNFYATVNELISRATTGTYTGIVDEATFVDFGKKLVAGEQIDKDTFMNAFAKEIANKVKLSIDTARDYNGKFKSLIRGQVSPNAVIEIITHTFFETRAAAFVTLTDGQSVDQYVINKGGQNVQYFIEDNAYQIPCTIQYTELEGAFADPAAMDRFLNAKIRYALNTNELAREEGRLGLVSALIKELDGASAAADVEAPAQKYKLVKLYNDIYNQSLTAEDALYSGEFIKFAVNMIKKVRNKLSNVSTSFNTSGIKTFTPKTNEDSQLLVHSALDGGIATYVVQDVRRPESLGDYEVVSYWQSEADPFVVSTLKADYIVATLPASGTANKVYFCKADGKHYKYANSAWSALSATDEDESSPVVAVLFDKYAIGEYVTHEVVHTTPFNAAGEYFNNWVNVQTKYVRNQDANAVIFTLEDE